MGMVKILISGIKMPIMLTSKQILDATKISRATLNNYIGLGLLPKPIIRKPGPGEGRARQIGYFPDECLALVQIIQKFKKRRFKHE